ncbi:uncharacterized protein LACBIDRAFT_335368 [Laccaria bicolor S238N-H82]|uniref:Predicted protein n=1 Tax=Laccaria bicolor (strain S238N-H82 / ATCC MYA-4686) TaxID=486041 RepID=B0E250_LACBS|nr:uncharacterized protein LACBIDRAFT_335368 [Laccaria bicolor S238N-H82]EDQ99077.1 predicted protein [Laccaria bicolor S238N-H82]|eukprot:XP_001890279.1 predicted protein [Laccaria bicolor S238N-H82]
MSNSGREPPQLDGRGGNELAPEAGHPYSTVIFRLSFCPRSDIENTVYYRLYTKNNPVESKNPIYSNDRCISRILVKSVAPPRNIGSLKKHLWKIEDLDGTPTNTLYLSLSEKAPANDLTHLQLKGGPSPGSSELDPMALVVESPKLRKKLAAGSKVDSKTLPEWPHEHRYVYYRVYEEAGEVSSKTSFDETDLSLGRVTGLSVPPPHSGASLEACLIQAEKIPSQNVKLFKDDGGENILNHNEVLDLFSDNYPGVLLDDPIAIVHGPKKQEHASEPEPHSFSKRLRANQDSARQGEIFQTDGILTRKRYYMDAWRKQAFISKDMYETALSKDLCTFI